jgi:hypothetical protein
MDHDDYHPFDLLPIEITTEILKKDWRLDSDCARHLPTMVYHHWLFYRTLSH